MVVQIIAPRVERTDADTLDITTGGGDVVGLEVGVGVGVGESVGVTEGVGVEDGVGVGVRVGVGVGGITVPLQLNGIQGKLVEPVTNKETLKIIV